MTELDTLIADQARDMRSHSVGSLSVDAWPSGADSPRTKRMVVTDERHGTENLYQWGRCRCARCRAAHAAYRQERRRFGKEAWK